MAKEKASQYDKLKAGLDVMVTAGMLSREEADKKLAEYKTAADKMKAGDFSNISDETVGKMHGIAAEGVKLRPTKTAEQKEADAITSAIQYSDKNAKKIAGKLALDKYGISDIGIELGDKITIKSKPTNEQVHENEAPIQILINGKPIDKEITVPLREVGQALVNLTHGLHQMVKKAHKGKDGATEAAANSVKTIFSVSDLSGDIGSTVDKIVQYDMAKTNAALKSSDLSSMEQEAEKINLTKLTDKLAEFQLSETPEHAEQRKKETEGMSKYYKEQREAARQQAAQDQLDAQRAKDMSEAEAMLASGVKDISSIVNLGIKQFADTRSKLPENQRTDYTNKLDSVMTAFESKLADYVKENGKMPNRNGSDNAFDALRKEVMQEQIPLDTDAKIKGPLIRAFIDNSTKLYSHIGNMARKANDLNSKSASTQLSDLADSDAVSPAQRDYIKSLLAKSKQAGFASNIKAQDLLAGVLRNIDAKEHKLNNMLNAKHKLGNTKDIADLEKKLSKLKQDRQRMSDFVKSPVNRITNIIAGLEVNLSDINSQLNRTDPEKQPRLYEKLNMNKQVTEAQLESFKSKLTNSQGGKTVIKDPVALGNMNIDDINRMIHYIKGPARGTARTVDNLQYDLANVSEKTWPQMYRDLKQRLDYYKDARDFYNYLPGQYKDKVYVTNSEIVKDANGNDIVKITLGDSASKTLKNMYGITNGSTAYKPVTEEERYANAQAKHDVKRAKQLAEIERITQEEEARRSPEEQARLNALSEESLQRADEAYAQYQAEEQKRRAEQSAKDIKKSTGITINEGDSKLKRSAELFLNGGQANSKLRNGREYLAQSIANALAADYPGVDISKHILNNLSLVEYAKGVVSGANKDYADKVRIDLGKQAKVKQQSITDAVSEAFEYMPEDPNNTQADKDNSSDYYD